MAPQAPLSMELFRQEYWSGFLFPSPTITNSAVLLPMETVTDFLFLGSKITVDGDSSYEIKRRVLLGRKVMTNLDDVLKSRDIILPTKVWMVKALVFPVVMYGCKS